jgi:hypothetical protein
MNEKRIKEIESRMAEIRETINNITSDLQSEERRLHAEMLALKSPFKTGDIIAWGKKKGRVIELREWGFGNPMWVVNNIRADGTEGAESLVRSYNGPTLVK